MAWVYKNGSAHTKPVNWWAWHRSTNSHQCLPALCLPRFPLGFLEHLDFRLVGLFVLCSPKLDSHTQTSVYIDWLSVPVKCGFSFPAFSLLQRGWWPLFIYFPFTLLCSVAAVIRKWVILGWTLRSCLFQRACLPGKFLQREPSQNLPDSYLCPYFIITCVSV